MRTQTIEELAESYVNGNITWVKNKVKKMSKLDFYFLLVAICGQSNNDMEHVAHILTN